MFIYTCVYTVEKWASMHAHCTTLSSPLSGHLAGDSPAFHQHHAEEISYITPTIFNWVLNGTCFFLTVQVHNIYSERKSRHLSAYKPDPLN